MRRIAKIERLAETEAAEPTSSALAGPSPPIKKESDKVFAPAPSLRGGNATLLGKKRDRENVGPSGSEKKLFVADPLAILLGTERGSGEGHGSARGLTLAEAKAALEALSATVAAAEKAERRQQASVATQIAADELLNDRLRIRHRLIRFNVGGQIFTVPLANLDCFEGSFFDVVRKCEEAEAEMERIQKRNQREERQRNHEDHLSVKTSNPNQVQGSSGGGNKSNTLKGMTSSPSSSSSLHESNIYLERDPTGAIFIDRDPDTFRIIMNYVRGYRGIPHLTFGLAHRLLADAEYYQLDELAAEMRYYVSGTIPSLPHQFSLPGAGVNLDRTRLRAVYNVCPLGDRLMLSGRHSVTFRVERAEYVGIGVISDECVSFDSEFHRTRNCCVYYMTGLTYTNFPFHKKEETSEKYGAGDLVTVTIDMQNKVVEYRIRDAIRCYSCASAVRLRFAVVIKFDSQVTIVDSSGNNGDDEGDEEDKNKVLRLS